jgi:VanZ family protein
MKHVLSIYFVVLIFLSLNPWVRPDSSQAIGNIAWDKVDHFAAYCLMSLLFLSMYRRHRPQWTVSFLVLLACSLVGVLLEYSQLWFTVTREFSYFDAIANVFGAVLGLTLFWCYRFAILISHK